VFDAELQRVLELCGIFVFAVSGALLAVEKRFDIIGMLMLAWITALGGGLIRDVVIGVTPPTAFLDLWAFSLPVGAAAITFFGHRVIERSINAILLFDAAGLALFTVVGTLKGVTFGLGFAQAAAVGVFTGVGGGLLRDIVAREIPVVVRADAELYSIPALIGAIGLASATSLWGYEPLIGLGATLLILSLRLAALAFGWEAPRVWRS